MSYLTYYLNKCIITYHDSQKGRGENIVGGAGRNYNLENIHQRQTTILMQVTALTLPITL